jgi:hypothetical protein
MCYKGPRSGGPILHEWGANAWGATWPPSIYVKICLDSNSPHERYAYEQSEYSKGINIFQGDYHFIY